MTRSWTCLAAALIAGCSQPDVVVPGPGGVALGGSVLGQITTRATGEPLPGVTVSAPLPYGVATATSGADGRYVLRDLPAGATHRLRFERAGYAPAFQDVALAVAAAGVAQDNAMATANVVLVAANAALEGTIRADGAPAAGAVVTLDLRSRGFDLVATAVADGAGHFRIDGLPAMPHGQVTDLVQPWDADGDGRAEYLGASTWFALHASVVTVLDLALTPAPGTSQLFRVVSTDVAGGTHAADTPVRIVFDRPVDVAGSWLSLRDTTTYRDVAVGWQAGADASSLLVAPVGDAPLAPGHSYRLEVQGRALDGSSASGSYAFTASTGGSPPPPVTGLSTEPAFADWNTKALTLRWLPVAEADRYEIWVRDTAGSPAFSLVQTVGTQPAPAATVTLPEELDWYTGDGVQTPFLWGTAVDLAVVPIGVAGASGGVGAATPLRLRDGTSPVVVSASQSGSADATGLGTQAVSLTLTFAEYVDPGSAATVLLPAALVGAVTVDPGLRQAQVSIPVPAGVDATGVVTVTGLTDTSGNPMVPWSGRLLRRSRLTANSGFEAGTLAGWAPSTSGTASPPAWVAAPAASGGGAVRLGAEGASPQSGYSRIHQDVVVPANAVSIGVTVAHRGATTASSAYDDLDCGVYTTGGALLASVVDAGVTSTPAFAVASRWGLTGYAGTTVRVQCQLYQWGSYASRVWIDDLELWVDQ